MFFLRWGCWLAATTLLLYNPAAQYSGFAAAMREDNHKGSVAPLGHGGLLDIRQACKTPKGVWFPLAVRFCPQP